MASKIIPVKNVDGNIYNKIIKTLFLTLEMRDAYTAAHQKRVSKLAYAIAIELGLPDQQVEAIRLSGLIHDLGKIAIPSEILSKPGKLTEIEFNLIKTHPRVGYEILKEIQFPWSISNIILQHHERLDGSGYPYGMKRKDGIMIEARILAVADTFEAMATHRPYRASLGENIALEELINGSNKIYDEDAVYACVKLITSNRVDLSDI